MVKHPLHEELGRRFSNWFRDKVLTDHAHGEVHRLPLFCNIEKSRETEFCNVDMLILKDGMVKVIIEIEESNIKRARFIPQKRKEDQKF